MGEYCISKLHFPTELNEVNNDHANCYREQFNLIITSLQCQETILTVLYLQGLQSLSEFDGVAHIMKFRYLWR
jgi:hypothetical protein